MAVSINGYIARDNDDTSWISKAEWASYRRMAKQTGNIIVGSKTFQIAVRDGDFPFPNALNIVVSEREIKNKWGDRVIFVSDPFEALAALKGGFSTALVGGGGQLNTSFIRTGLIDEVYLDVEPIILGRGLKLFRRGRFEAKLQLLGTKKLSKNEIQLHYKVLK